MSAFSLMIRVDAVPVPGDSAPPMFSPASQQLRQALYPKLGLKVHNAGWVTIIPGTKKADATIAALVAEREAGRAVAGAAILTETFDRDHAASAPWSFLNTRLIDDFSLWDDYPGCKAGTLPKVHALNHTFVSTAFVAACERRGLSGVSFLQCANTGRKAGDPWFVALPDHSLGRGLDHPWFSRERWGHDTRFRADRRTTARDVGQSQFHQCWLNDSASNEAPLDRVLTLCPTPKSFASGLDGLQVVTIPRYWAGALPAADFAFVPWGEDGENREGKIMRFRQLAISAKARAALIDECLFDAKAFLPVRAIDTPEPGVVLLDRQADPLPPMFTAEELAVLRARERELKNPPSSKPTNSTKSKRPRVS
jgi:hypothetical protein